MVVYQPQHGFRYGSEVFWLVGFALEGRVAHTAADLGTGSGVAALLLGAQGIATVGVDLRPEWRACWERSLGESVPSAPVRFVCADVRDWRGEPVDLVVSNPPFFPRSTGPASSDAWKAAARTESTATLRDFLGTALDVLAEAGRACLVLPVERTLEITATAKSLGGRTARRVQVGRRRVLVEVTRAPGPTAPVVVLDEHDQRVRGWYARLGARPAA
ncbi:MAG: methyltransferase domain-containing protein [Deltaproteobacteria bacterium]|nr:methyltransferase domain-containing protein [Deltaproteobacteria bacterium]